MTNNDREEVELFAKWPVPADVRADLVDLRLSHKIIELPIYDEHGEFVPASKANAALRDSLVEVHFHLKHYAIRNNGTPKFDTFTAIAQQITILQRAPPRKANPYRKGLRNGPVKYVAKPAKPAMPKLPEIPSNGTLASLEDGPLEHQQDDNMDAACLPPVETLTQPILPASLDGEQSNVGKGDCGGLNFAQSGTKRPASGSISDRPTCRNKQLQKPVEVAATA